MWTEVKVVRGEDTEIGRLGQIVLAASTVFFAVCLMAAVMNLVDRAPAVGPLHGPAATASDR
ncbi:MAG: hypothetical protein AAFN09_00435 [Pseudomonadota bacterium]